MADSAVQMLTLKGAVAALPLDWRVKEDPLDWFLLRLFVDREEMIFVEARFRFETGKAGIESLAKALEQGRTQLLAHRQLAGLRHYWKRFTVATDGRDLVVSLSLGRPRQAAGQLIQLCAPMWAWLELTSGLKIPKGPVRVK